MAQTPSRRGSSKREFSSTRFRACADGQGERLHLSGQGDAKEGLGLVGLGFRRWDEAHLRAHLLAQHRHLVHEPLPLCRGERVSSQGTRKKKKNVDRRTNLRATFAWRPRRRLSWLGGAESPSTACSACPTAGDTQTLHTIRQWSSLRWCVSRRIASLDAGMARVRVRCRT